MDEMFPALCTPDALLPLLRAAPDETLLDPGIYGQKRVCFPHLVQVLQFQLAVARVGQL
jgi:hypothetical protein